MAGALKRYAAGAFAERLEGRRPSRRKALATSGGVGAAAAVLTYRFLRSGHEAEKSGGSGADGTGDAQPRRSEEPAAVA